MSGEMLADEMIAQSEAQFMEEISKGVEDTQKEGEGQEDISPETGEAEENKQEDNQEVDNKETDTADEEKQPTTGDDKEAATSEPVESELPENLKPFEKMITAKGGVDKILESYQDMEKFNGQRAQEVGLLNDRNKDINNILLSSAEDINKHRTAQGLPALPFDSKSVDDKLSSHSEMWNHIVQAFNGRDAEGNLSPQASDSLNWLNNWNTKTSEDLRFDKRDIERSANVQQPDRTGNAKTNMANLQTANPNENTNDILDNLFKKNPAIDSLFNSFGVGPFEMMSSPERAAAGYELAKHVNRSMNFDTAVKAEVTKQLEAMREKGNSSTPGLNSKTSKSATENNAPVNDKGEIQTSKEDFEFYQSGSIL